MRRDSGRVGGWWGIAFVVLLLVSAAMASLPTSADSDSSIARFYRDHGTIVVLQQIVGAIALVPFVAFALSLNPNRWLRPATFVFVVAELITNVVPLVILAVPGAVRQLTLVEDIADAALFVSVALFVAAATLTEPLWLRVVAYVVAALCVIRALASPLHADILDQIAPVAFVGFVLLLSVLMLVRGRSIGGADRATGA